MNKLSRQKRVQVIAALVEGNSIRSTVRMTGVAKNTVVKLLADIGSVCADYQDEALRNLTCERIQPDAGSDLHYQLHHFLLLLRRESFFSSQ